MGRNLGASPPAHDVEAYVGSTALHEGDYLTGGYLYRAGAQIGAAAISDIYVQNGVVKITFTPANGVYCHLHRMLNGTYTRAVESLRGDWTYFVTDPPAPDIVRVIDLTPDRCELAVEWTAYAFSPGIPSFDNSNFPNYASGQSGVDYKRITSTKLVKSVVVKRGAEGFEMGYHTDPRIGPFAEDIPLYNNESDWGERETGPLSGVAVGFSSANKTVRHPDEGASTYYDIDNPPYGSTEQETGPWWVAGLHYDSATYPFCNYSILRQRLETGSWQFGPEEYGHIVIHYTNEASDSAGVPYRTMVFHGCFPYTASGDLTTAAGRLLEPTAALKNTLANKAATYVWD